MSLAFWLAAVLLLCGCSMKNGTLDESPASEDGKEKLVLWSYYETKEQHESLDRLAEEFNNAQGRYQIRWEYHGPVIEFNKQLALALTEKELPDLVIADQSDMQEYIRKGLLEDMTSYVENSGKEDQYYQAAMESAKSQGRYYGMPFCCNTTALFFNKELFLKAGIEAPETPREFVLAAKALSDGETYGFGMSAVSGSQSALNILPWIVSEEGGEDIPKRADVQSFFEIIRELVQSGSMPKECINWSSNDVARSFLAGDIAMMENSMNVLTMLEKSNISAGVVKLPSGTGRKSVAGGENIGILKGKNITGAMAFLDFYLEDQVMEEICGSQFGMAPKKELAAKQAGEDARYRVFEEELESSVSGNHYTEWFGKAAALSDALTNVILEKKTPEKVAEELVKEE